MAQLDEARTITDTIAAHLSDHNTLHAKANYVFDVTDYGATGDGTTDDTTMIQAAITAASAVGGGTVYIPAGDYRVTATLTVPTHTVIVGANPGNVLLASDAGGTRILPETQDQAVFTLSHGIRKSGIRDLSIVGDGVVTGMVGILIVGVAATADIQNLQFHNLRIYRLARGIYVNPTSGALSVVNVSVSDCSLQEMSTAAIHINSQNADFWRISNCWITSAACIYLERSGMIHVDAVAAGGINGADDIFIRSETTAGPTVFTSCQAENIDHFVQVETGVGSYYSPFTFIGCVVDAPITVDANWKLILIGCRINADINANATDVLVTAIGNTLTGATYNLTGNSRLLEFDDGSLSFNVTSLGFYNATPVARPTGVAVTAAGVHAALVSLGLITA